MRLILPLLALLSTPAMAQEGPKCAPYDQVAGMLASEFHETRVHQGIGPEGSHMLAIFASPEGKTWSAVIIKSDGSACLVDGGTDWQTRHDPVSVPEEGL